LTLGKTTKIALLRLDSMASLARLNR